MTLDEKISMVDCKYRSRLSSTIRMCASDEDLVVAHFTAVTRLKKLSSIGFLSAVRHVRIKEMTNVTEHKVLH